MGRVSDEPDDELPAGTAGEFDRTCNQGWPAGFRFRF